MTAGKGIPFVDLITPHLDLEEELVAAARNTIRSAGFIGGPVLEQFERDFAEFCGVSHSVGVSSGTDALRFMLMAADIGAGDIVVTVPNTFVATIEAIIQAGATPRFVDVNPETSNMDVEALDAYLGSQCDRPEGARLLVDRTSGGTVKAVMPVHLYGQMCDMDSIRELSDKYELLIFEDACQAHGSQYFSQIDGRWQKAGSIGKAAAFSFYPGKNLGACGEAGAVTTNDEALAERMRMIRDHGQNKKYHHLVEGYNGRLDSIQAAMLSIKLRHLEEWNTNRQAAARSYDDLLRAVENVRTLSEPEWSRGVYHLYVILTPERDDLHESSPFLVETLHGSRWVMQPSSSISSTSSPQFSALAGGLRGALEDDGSRSPSSGAVRCR